MIPAYILDAVWPISIKLGTLMQNNIVYKYKLPRSLWPTFYIPVDIFLKIESVATVQVSDLWALGL